jgi:predicted CXXCH cytochrome family protein
VVISCTTISRVVLKPPSVAGASFVGSAECADCHEEIVNGFADSTHSRLMVANTTTETGCESCHGPGSLHSDSGGSPLKIVNPLNSASVCFECHLDKRGEFSLEHTHPVLDGKVSCIDCHDPHKGPAVAFGGMNLDGVNDNCFKCHQMQKGPFVFEHEALREGCTVCHLPHGSVNPKMLRARNTTLCLQCHFQEQTQDGQILIGGLNHTFFLPRGTCWTAGCHEAVHGSHVNSSLRY